MSLSNDDRKALVEYRIEKARKSFEEAQKVAAISLWDLAAIRQMFNMRHEGDYEDFEEASEEDIMEAAPKVKQLVEKLIGINKLSK